MSDLDSIIAELGAELHADRIAHVASRIEGLASSEQFSLIRKAFGVNTDKQLIDRLEKSWKISSRGPAEIAAAMRSASATASLLSRRGSVDLVWTGPSSAQVPIRHTEQVLLEVIQKAVDRLFIVSFVAYNMPTVLASLKDALARKVQVKILLELSSEHGGHVSNHDSIDILKKHLPTAEFLVWAQNPSSGSVHAKCAVADERIAFITSANLTMAAMEKNMELGVLIQGGGVPIELHRHLDSLVENETLAAFH